MPFFLELLSVASASIGVVYFLAFAIYVLVLYQVH